ncbi:MAG: cation transporter [Bacilli bacterium]|nr:cation transporter [Bacilli bacterium]
MDRFKSVKRASILGIVGNLFLLVIKGIIGFITNSQAMIADAFNSAGDIFSSVMTFIGNKISSKPRDDDHDLGHGKAEYIYSMLISVSMFLITLKVLKGSILSLFNHSNYEFSWFLIVVCIITIIIKLLLFIYTNNLSKKHSNLLIKANARDHISDCLITVFNLISCLLTLLNFYFFDSIVGIGISIWIMVSSFTIFMESYNVLMDKSMSKETKQKVLDIIGEHDEIKRVIHFNSTPIGYLYQISFTIYVDGDMTTFESHKIADDLEKEIKKRVDEVFLTVIHVNPIRVKKN